MLKTPLMLAGLCAAGTLTLLAQPTTKLVSEHQIAQAESTRQQYPVWSPAAAALGHAYVFAYRETGDPAFLTKAMAQVRESLKLEANSPAALKVQARILLEQHDDLAARDMLESLLKRGPDDLEVSSLLATAYLDLGQYEKAEESAQFIRDLRPAELMGYHRGAEVREALGDLGGALVYYREAFVRTPVDEQQEKAFILVQMAHVLWISGNESGAVQTLQQTQQLVPNYYRAAVEQGRELLAHNDAKGALAAIQQAPSPAPDWLYVRALALQMSGDSAGAADAWKKFTAAQPRPALLARYYVEAVRQPDRALALLEPRVKAQPDVETLHLMAWAYLENKQYDRGAEILNRALRVGVRDPEMLYHAVILARARSDAKAAAQYERELTALNANSPFVARLREPAGTR